VTHFNIGTNYTETSYMFFRCVECVSVRVSAVLIVQRIIISVGHKGQVWNNSSASR